ncbi:hypothetical protein LX59_00699 [Azomonas agilis]|uniref:Uncharacterized protein n=1 Tax=Azomonas agilis TaxID=116849 RepID=A0A562J1E6_9GAMM|nr:hypothetical protein [Azomonas agilis]TWH76654.1 hypothetical protein LX59_00699 [Azomonas agilis]
MSTLADLALEREKRIHNIHERRLEDVRKAFERALPLNTPAPKNKKKAGKSSKKPGKK